MRGIERFSRLSGFQEISKPRHVGGVCLRMDSTKFSPICELSRMDSAKIRGVTKNLEKRRVQIEWESVEAAGRAPN